MDFLGFFLFFVLKIVFLCVVVFFLAYGFVFYKNEKCLPIRYLKDEDFLSDDSMNQQEIIKTRLAEMENEAKEVIKSSPLQPVQNSLELVESEAKEVVTTKLVLPVSPAPSVPSESTPLTRAMPYYRRFTHGDNNYCFRFTQPAKLGEAGESVVLDDLKRLDRRYAILHNVVLKTELGDTTQIDFVVLSVYGIFVLEVKNYSGWIFGSEPQELWTQVLYHEKNKFLNPLRQNYKHIKALSYILALPTSTFHSVIVFPSPEITFKTFFPSNVVRSAYNYIRQHKSKIFTGKKIETITKTIISAQTIH